MRIKSPVSPTGLFGPAVAGFAKRVTTAQKSSQAMQHFLPKRSSSAATSSHPKMAQTQQPAKTATPAVQPASQPPSPSPAHLRFAFKGVAYQFTVIPFGLSLAPHTFTKCMDAALSQQRQMGFRILNYFDD